MEITSPLPLAKRAAPRPTVFFLVTFLASWLIWIPTAFAHFGVNPLNLPEGLSTLLRLVGVLMPSTVAICLTAIFGGRPAVRELLGRLKIARVGGFWWFAAAGVMPILLLLVALVYTLSGTQPKLVFFNQFNLVGFIVNVIILAIATLGEEIGWRGVALPGLLDEENPHPRFTPMQASLLLGAMATLWHIPYWLPQDPFDWYGPIYLVMCLLSILPMTIFMTWLYLNTRRSLLMPVAWHLSYNIINVAVVEVTGLLGPYWMVIGLQWVLVGVLVWKYGPGLKK